MSSAMGIDELSDNSTDISHNAVPQRHEEQTMKGYVLLYFLYINNEDK